MAGPIRQQIDLDSLAKYIDKTVLEIKTPLDVKQVSFIDIYLKLVRANI